MELPAPVVRFLFLTFLALQCLTNNLASADDREDAAIGKNDVTEQFKRYRMDLGKRSISHDAEDKRLFRMDMGKREDEDDSEDDLYSDSNALNSDLVKRFYRTDMGKRYRMDLGKRYRMDLGKRSMVGDYDPFGSDKRLSSYRFDMGKRAAYNFDMGKRAYNFDLGKRGYNFDLGKRYNFDLGKRFNYDLGKRYNFDLGKRYNFDLGKRELDEEKRLYKADMGKREDKRYRYDMGKRPAYRFDMGKRSELVDSNLVKDGSI